MASYHGTKNLMYDHVGKKAHKSEALKKKKESQLSKYGPLTKDVSPKLDKKLKRDFPANK